jgi:hypothetical protein
MAEANGPSATICTFGSDVIASSLAFAFSKPFAEAIELGKPPEIIMGNPFLAY